MSSSSPTNATPSPTEVYTLADLERWERPGPSTAALGHPVAHSVSPQLHNAALAELSRTKPALKNWMYFKFDVTPEQLPVVLPLFESKNFAGLNLTLPLKVAVVPLLREISDIGRAMGATNTLKRLPGGGWWGNNTDGYGMSQSIQRDLGVNIAGKTVALLGTGGAARAAAVQCLMEKCEHLWIGGRRAHAELHGFFHGDPRMQYFNIAKPPFEKWPDDMLIINATSLGLRHGDALPMDITRLKPAAAVLDMVYRRGETTPFVEAARKHGLRGADGVGMLVWQGALVFEIWTGEKAPAQTMMDAACKALDLPTRNA